MNDQQKQAFEIALAGHNLLILGSAGTGKSFTVKKIAENLINDGKKVKIACSTGIACTLYQDACTIHRFLGLNDGRYGPEQINQIHSENPTYQFVDKNLASVDCIILDESSMISRRTFNLIVTVCARKENPLQLIFCGDFLQLPPVPNDRYMDSGEHCFMDPMFTSVFPHKIVFVKNVRASEPDLVQMINNVFAGTITDKDKDFIYKLKRPLQPGNNSVKLFSNNLLVDGYNRDCILRFNGQLFEFVSTDRGDSSLLGRIAAPHILWLKKGCPVVLLQNLTDKLVNGLQGQVKNIDKDGVVVTFDGGRITSKIPKVKFSVFDPSAGTDVAVREQYPLRLAFGLTIHKAQGMTLDRVEIDCRDIFSPGQLGVALSRAKFSSGLRVINFHPRYVLKPQQAVTDFLKAPTQDVLDDLSCCRSKHEPHKSAAEQSKKAISVPTPDQTESISREEYRAPDPEDTVGEAEEFSMDDDFDDVLKAIVSDEGRLNESTIPDDLLREVNSNIFTETESTPFQQEMNEIVARISVSKLMLFVRKLLLKMKEFIKLVSSEEEISKPITEKSLNNFYEQVHKYSVGPEYKLNCILLYENEQVLTEEHMVICYKILETIRVYCLKKKVDLVKVTGSKVPHRFITDTSKARIRYVAGFCVAKLRRKYMKKEKTHMFMKNKEGQDCYLDSKRKLSILNLLKEDEQYLSENTSQPDSLIDVIQKQGRKRGLTNVTDNFYSFFLVLTKSCLDLLVDENLMKFGKDLFSHCFDTIICDKKLREVFSSLIVSKARQENVEEFDEVKRGDVPYNETNIKNVYEEITRKYLSVLLAQFRKDVKSSFKIEKKMAHRKQIKVSSSKQKQSESSAPKRKRSSVEKGTEVSTTDQPNISIEGQASGSTIEQQVPGTSYSTIITEKTAHSGSKRRPSKKRLLESDTDDDDKCQKCFMDIEDEFIQCDSCDKWFHRQCAGLKSVRMWKKITKSSSKWFCEKCS